MWMRVHNHPNYEVSDTGQVRRANDHKLSSRWPVGRELTQQKKPDGYLRVKIDGKHSYVAGIVAETFICPRPNGLEVNHKNGVKTDNSANNLEWVTKTENIAHAFRLGLNKGSLGADHPNAKLTESAVREIRKTPNGTRGLAAKYGVDRSLIWMIRKCKGWEHIQ